MRIQFIKWRNNIPCRRILTPQIRLISNQPIRQDIATNQSNRAEDGEEAMTTTIKQENISTMEMNSRNTDLMTIVAELGPKFAARAAEHDAEGTFVAEHFQEMRDCKLF